MSAAHAQYVNDRNASVVREVGAPCWKSAPPPVLCSEKHILSATKHKPSELLVSAHIEKKKLIAAKTRMGCGCKTWLSNPRFLPNSSAPTAKRTAQPHADPSRPNGPGSSPSQLQPTREFLRRARAIVTLGLRCRARPPGPRGSDRRWRLIGPQRALREGRSGDHDVGLPCSAQRVARGHAISLLQARTCRRQG